MLAEPMTSRYFLLFVVFEVTAVSVVSAFLAMAGARNIVLLLLCTTLFLFPTIVNAICSQSKSLNSVRKFMIYCVVHVLNFV